jgi:hypothetical protein
MNATQLYVDGCRIIVGGAVVLLLEAAGSRLIELEVGGLGLVFDVCMLAARLFHVTLYALTYPAQ